MHKKQKWAIFDKICTIYSIYVYSINLRLHGITSTNNLTVIKSPQPCKEINILSIHLS